MAISRAILLFLTGIGLIAVAPLAQQPAPSSGPARAADSSQPITIKPARRATNSAPQYNYPPPPAYLAAPPQFFPPPPVQPANLPAVKAPTNAAMTPAFQKEIAKRSANTNIVFDANIKEAVIKPGELTADFKFSLTNVGPNEVTIHSVRASCGCTTPMLPTMPWKLAPGASGSFSVSSDLRGKSGVFQKSVMLDTTDGMKIVYVKVNIPTGAGVAGVDARARNMQMAQADRQVVFRNDCAECHVRPAIGKMGEPLFVAACGICHEAEHRATMVPDLHALKATPTAAYWEAWVRNGKIGTLMPAFAQEHGGPLTDEQINSLVAFLDKDFPKRKPPVHTAAGPDGGAVHPK